MTRIRPADVRKGKAFEIERAARSFSELFRNQTRRPDVKREVFHFDTAPPRWAASDAKNEGFVFGTLMLPLGSPTRPWCAKKKLFLFDTLTTLRGCWARVVS